jgi:hypothetical protein
MRYIISRWGYSTNLGVLQFFSEQDNWDGHKDHALDVNTSNQIVFSSLQSSLSWYIKGLDFGKMHLLSSSYGELPFTYENNVFSDANMDITSVNKYGYDKGIGQTYYEAFHEPTEVNLNDGTLLKWDKPSMHCEMGFYNKGTAQVIVNGNPFTVPHADPNDMTSCSDIEFHNAMWSTAFSATVGCGLNWWQWNRNDYRTQNFPAIRSYFDLNGDFESLTWTNAGTWKDPSSNVIVNRDYYKHVKIEAYYLVSSSNDHVRGWAHNATSYWGNTIQSSCKDRWGLEQSLPSDDDEDTTIALVGGINVARVEGMNYGRYIIQRYNTRGAGGTLGSTFHNWTDIFGRLKIDWYGQVPDFAFTADRDPFGGRFVSDSNIVSESNSDTLIVCLSDTIHASGYFFDDTLGLNIYRWYINNTLYAVNQRPSFVFDVSGLFNIRVDISDGMDTIASIDQLVLVTNCADQSNTRLLELKSDKAASGLMLYPNPTSNFVQIHGIEDSSENSTCVIYSLDGKIIMEIAVYRNDEKIDVSNLMDGIYILEIRTRSRRQYFKLLKAD